MKKTTIRRFILTCLFVCSIILILTAASDNPPSQAIMIAVVSGELSESEIVREQQPFLDLLEERVSFLRFGNEDGDDEENDDFSFDLLSGFDDDNQ